MHIRILRHSTAFVSGNEIIISITDFIERLLAIGKIDFSRDLKERTFDDVLPVSIYFIYTYNLL